MITAELVRGLFDYDKTTGVMFRRGPLPSRSRAKLGVPAGWIDTRGYRIVNISGKNYQVHRLAWLYTYGEWPAGDLDHINGDPLDNRIANLRLATASQNQGNARLRRDNTSGFKGVTYNPDTQKWIAQIKCRGKQHQLGYFASPEEAHAAYINAAKRLYGEFARAG